MLGESAVEPLDQGWVEEVGEVLYEEDGDCLECLGLGEVDFFKGCALAFTLDVA